MADPWTAEVVVDPRLARSLVESQFPEFRGATLEPLGVGWDNTAYLVDRAWVFRFPRRKIALPLNARELALLPVVAPRLPLPVPVPTKIGRATDAFAWPFAGCRFLPGQTVAAAGLDDARRAALAEPLARFLAALHAFPVEEAAALGAKPDEIGKLDVEHRERQASAGLDELRAAGALDADVVPGLKRALDVPPHSDFRPALVHGDLYGNHVLVDDAGRACGVIDWGDCHLGDAAVDLSAAHILLPPSAHAAFRRAYGAIDDATWNLARFRAVVHATACLRYARSVGDADMKREAEFVVRCVSGA